MTQIPIKTSCFVFTSAVQIISQHLLTDVGSASRRPPTSSSRSMPRRQSRGIDRLRAATAPPLCLGFEAPSTEPLRERYLLPSLPRSPLPAPLPSRDIATGSAVGWPSSRSHVGRCLAPRESGAAGSAGVWGGA